MSIYLIQGFFFQDWFGFSVEHRAESQGGTHAVVRGGLGRFMFAGTIWEEDGVLHGEMTDHFGESELSDIHLEQDGLSFRKIYDDRSEGILYAFKGKGMVWAGNYEGPLVGKGHANCILTRVPDELFLPDGDKAWAKDASQNT